MLLVACGMTVIPHNTQMLEALAPGEIQNFQNYLTVLPRLNIILFRDDSSSNFKIEVRSLQSGSKM